MESAQYAIFSSLGGSLIADYSNRVQSLSFSSNNRGWAECAGFVPMGLEEAFSLYDHAGLLSIAITDSAGGTVYAGRLEDVAITGDGVTLTALGYSRSLSDAPYTALWSDTRVGNWQPITSDMIAGFRDEPYVMDTNNRLFIGTNKGNTYANGADVGAFYFAIPSLSTRSLLGMSFDYTMLAPVNWQFRYEQRGADFSGISSNTLQTGTGAAQAGALHLTFTPCAMVTLLLVNLTGGASTPPGESGANFLKITNVRVITSTVNRVNTYLTVTRTGGVNVTATVASTAGMYVGMRLIINSGAATSESVVVLSIGSSTTFNATFAGTNAFNSLVQGFQIFADEVVDDLIATTAALNSGQLSSSLALTDSPGLDLLQEVYEDRLPSDILDYLVAMGDSAARVWEWGVSSAQRLYFRVRSAQRTWYIDVSDLNIERTLDLLSNSIYAVYSDANDRRVAAVATSDTASVARYGLTRRLALEVNTSSAVQASYQQAAALSDRKDPRPRSHVTVRQVYDAGGNRWPLWAVQAGDTILIRNLSPTLSTALDRVRSFRLARVSYAFDSDTLELEPEVPRTSLEAIVAQQALK